MFLMKFFLGRDFDLGVTASPFCEELDPEDTVSPRGRGLSAPSTHAAMSGMVSTCFSPDALPATMVQESCQVLVWREIDTYFMFYA